MGDQFSWFFLFNFSGFAKTVNYMGKNDVQKHQTLGPIKYSLFLVNQYIEFESRYTSTLITQVSLWTCIPSNWISLLLIIPDTSR